MTVLEGIRVLETRYKGYRFRSRLEARWAVFFSNLGLRWEHEPEGFELGNGVHYFPDFRVFTPQGRSIWYEVKPASTLYDDKFSAFKKAAENAVDDYATPSTPMFRAALLSGDPMDHIGRDGGAGRVEVCPRCSFIAAPGYGSHWETLDPPHYDFGCAPCDFETPCGGGNAEEPGLFSDVPVQPHKGSLLVEMAAYRRFLRRRSIAQMKAREVRFEYERAPQSSDFVRGYHAWKNSRWPCVTLSVALGGCRDARPS